MSAIYWKEQLNKAVAQVGVRGEWVARFFCRCHKVCTCRLGALVDWARCGRRTCGRRLNDGVQIVGLVRVAMVTRLTYVACAAAAAAAMFA
jgi:hypothetical protein